MRTYVCLLALLALAWATSCGEGSSNTGIDRAPQSQSGTPAQAQHPCTAGGDATKPFYCIVLVDRSMRSFDSLRLSAFRHEIVPAGCFGMPQDYFCVRTIGCSTGNDVSTVSHSMQAMVSDNEIAERYQRKGSNYVKHNIRKNQERWRGVLDSLTNLCLRQCQALPNPDNRSRLLASVRLVSDVLGNIPGYQPGSRVRVVYISDMREDSEQYNRRFFTNLPPTSANARQWAEADYQLLMEEIGNDATRLSGIEIIVLNPNTEVITGKADILAYWRHLFGKLGATLREVG